MLDHGIDEEIRHHLRERAEALVELGWSERAAMGEARRRFGNVSRVRSSLHQIAEEEPRIRLLRWLGSVAHDLRGGVRALRQAPGLSTAVVLTIALGVGANVAVFSVTDAVLLRPLPYAAPDRLVSLLPVDQEDGRSTDWTSPERAFAWQRTTSSYAEITLRAQVMLVHTGADDPYQVAGHAVSTNWLRMLGVTPERGRGFSELDAVPDRERVCVLSHEFWRARLGGDPDVLGRVIVLDQQPHTVVGVMPAGFRFPPTLRTDAWVPLASDAIVGGDRLNRIRIVAAIPDGQSIDQLELRLAAIGDGLQGVDPDPAGWSLRAAPLDSFRANADVTRALWMMTAAVSVLLGVAMLNAINLLLARASRRAADIVVRAALGASRARLIRQELTETLVLVGLGGAAAVVLAFGLVQAIAGLLPSEITSFLVGNVAVDQRALAFALGVTTIVGVVLGVLPGWRATGGGLAGRSTRWSSAERSSTRLRGSLVVAQIAMSVTLLVVAGLLIRSFVRLTAVDPGYDARNLLQVSIELPGHSYGDPVARGHFFRALRDELHSLPGVVSASLANGVPPEPAISFGLRPQADGREPRPLPQDYLPSATVDEEFFPTLGVPIVVGRNFTDADGLDGDKVIVDRALARFLFNGTSAVGRRFRLDSDRPWLTVVGMIEDLKLIGQDDRRGSMDLFYPSAAHRGWGYMSVIMRTAGPPTDVAPEVRRVIRGLDPAVPVDVLVTGTQALVDSVDKPRFFLRMMSSFALIALVLAAIGTYGVLEFAVRERRREIGVRIALGANAGDVRRMVLGDGLRLAVTGLTLGIGGALVAGRAAASLLFEVAPADLATLAGVGLLMLATATLACALPAARAMRLDPVEVLRSE